MLYFYLHLQISYSLQIEYVISNKNIKYVITVYSVVINDSNPRDLPCPGM